MSNNTIDNWLRNEERHPGLRGFNVFDVTEHSSRTTLTVQLLQALTAKFLFEEQVLKDLRALLGARLCQALNAVIPSTPNLRSGAIGEAMSAEICERWHAYVVPLKRLRITGGSPPGTDLLALRIGEDNQLTEVCYIECKLRTVAAPGTAIDAYEQLIKARQEYFPQISLHLANYLSKTRSPVYPSFMNYLASRATEPAIESYRIALTWESGTWSERVLTNLDDKGVTMTPLSIDVIRIAKLKSLINTVYNSLGYEALNDDEQH